MTKQNKAERIAELKAARAALASGKPVDLSSVIAYHTGSPVVAEKTQDEFLAEQTDEARAAAAAKGQTLDESGSPDHDTRANEAAAEIADEVEPFVSEDDAEVAYLADITERKAAAAARKPTAAEAQARLQAVRTAAAAALPEREGPVDGIATALIARQNVILIGPPGTGKSLTVRLVLSALLGSSETFFQWLLGRTTKDEEILGPVSFSGLKEDRYSRVTRGKLPEAKAAFLDEIFKAGSSLLNNLLTILNERLFFNDGDPVKVPLEIVVGASNEYPQDESLAALYDRFQHRYFVRYISDQNSMRRLLSGGTPSTLSAALLPGDLDALRAAAESMAWGDREVNTLLNIKAALESNGHQVSDRTWVSLRAAVRARAVVNGHARVESSDWMVLGDMLWNEHGQRDAYVAIIGNAADPHGMQSAAIVDASTKAVRALPDFSLITNGTMTVDAASEVVGKVLSQLRAASSNLSKVEGEAAGHSSVVEARAKLTAHLGVAKALLAKLADYDPQN